MYTISQLFIYPVKSLGGIEVQTAPLTDRGLQYDRRWMLVDAGNHFLTQREFPAMSLLQTTIENDQLIIYDKNNPADKIALSLLPMPAPTVSVQVWDDECAAQYIGEFADEWFTRKLSIQCRLVYMPESEKRRVDQRYARNNEITGFADGYPLLLIGQASLDDLNSRLQHPVAMDRFRPNIVFTGGQPYDEDKMEHIVVNEIDMYGVKLCARCVITCIDQATGVKAKEPLLTLSGYRRKENKVYFGQNVVVNKPGILNVGAALIMA